MEAKDHVKKELSGVRLVLVPESEAICRTYQTREVVDSPTWNRYRSLLTDWRVNRIPSNELIELLIDVLPLDIERLLEERYDEGYSEGEKDKDDEIYEAKLEICNEFASNLPCISGITSFRKDLDSLRELAHQLEEASITLREDGYSEDLAIDLVDVCNSSVESMYVVADYDSDVDNLIDVISSFGRGEF